MKGESRKLIENQIHRWILEQKAAKEAEGRTRPAAPEGPLRPIITVSSQIGSGGTELAEMVAVRLGYPLMDHEMIDVVAEESGVDKGVLEALDQHTRSGIEQWVDGVLHNRLVSGEDYVRSLGKALITISRTGSAVVVGRGANFILDGEPGLHVRTVAGFDFRVRRVVRLQGMDREEAGELVARTDKERAGFVERYIHRDITDPEAYDLMLNLERVGLERGVDLVVNLYRNMFQ